MTHILDTVLDKAFPEAGHGYLSEALGMRAQQEKLLLTLASLPDGRMAVAPAVAPRIAQERKKLQRLLALGADIVQHSSGAATILKGPRHGRLYPAAVERYQADLDILFTEELAYVGSLFHLRRLGMVQKAGHITQAPDGRLYASSIFYEPDHMMNRGPDSLVAELHFRAFPITPFSHLDMEAPAVAALDASTRDALVLLAEFIYRDGRTKRFLYRDVLDSLLVFSQLTVEQASALAVALDACVLWIALGLLRAHLDTIGWAACPASLQLLFADPRCPVPPPDYDFYEHQALPYLQSKGRSRQDYQFLFDSYRQINPRDGHAALLTPFEIGARFARGVPVAFRLNAHECGTALLDACDLLAGPPDDRTVVHQRIGVKAPSHPQS